MSEDTNPQAVVEKTDAPPQAGTEGTDARVEGGELDTLHKSYDEQTTKPAAATPPTPEQKPGTDPDLSVVAGKLQQIESFITETHNAHYKRDMGDTVKAIRGDLDPEVFDDAVVEAWLNVQAQQDPRLSRAWIDRLNNPKQFEQVKTALTKNFQKKFSKLPDRQATDDREAVTAAVRGASTRTPESKPPDYSKLSQSDFEKEKEKLFGS